MMPSELRWFFRIATAAVWLISMVGWLFCHSQPVSTIAHLLTWIAVAILWASVAAEIIKALHPARTSATS